ncbi:MAG: glucosaminidase domain-containing protein [Roseibium sp.]|uniref:glucosaminidase domain-containing protein n=2 Tax=Roseibium sp. TaxID=1936156 RepID=UPI001B208F0D|nr:glucosaminidase domain-containing protein [Roseibium sp.]MBO6890420.1 glucosaminidase domain-containing protein [Roseibium sp.]MBO6929139.1 glucosaminidase domain-containing protein [Roseibium sp.]
MAVINQSELAGKIRDRPIGKRLEALLSRAADAAGIDEVRVTSGGQPGSAGKTTGSTRHNGGRAADLYLIANGKKLSFSDKKAPREIEMFVTACAALGANGIGAGVGYMGKHTLHIGFGVNKSDSRKIAWGAKGRSANAPKWLRDATQAGWFNPPSWVFALDDAEPEDLPEDFDEILEIAFGESDDGSAASNASGSLGNIPARFNEDVIRAAQAAQRQWGTPASVTLAQWAIESAYGSRMPTGSNNPFGIKARSGDKFVEAWTTEVIGGKSQKVLAKFQAFPDLDAAFIRHGRLLGTSKYYTKARQFTHDADKFADALTGIYATDPKYGSKLKSIMKSNDLYRFNLPVAGAPSTSETTGPDMSDPLMQGHPDKIRVSALQQALVALGYRLGKVDGIFGQLTSEALLAFQNENGLPTTGVVDEATQVALSRASPRRFDANRENASENDIAQGGSRTMINARRSRVLSWITGVFGALGVGNSAVVNSANEGAAAAPSALPADLLPFLAEVQQLTTTVTVQQVNALTQKAQALSAQLGGASLPPEVLSLIEQLKSSISAEVLASNPQIARVLELLGQATGGGQHGMRTVFDVLPSFFANGTVLEAVMQGVATVGASVLPGVGGSVGLLAAGVFGRLFANRVASARLNDHRTGANINPLK